jgi:hypothetical protein
MSANDATTCKYVPERMLTRSRFTHKGISSPGSWPETAASKSKGKRDRSPEEVVMVAIDFQISPSMISTPLIADDIILEVFPSFWFENFIDGFAANLRSRSTTDGHSHTKSLLYHFDLRFVTGHSWKKRTLLKFATN